MSWILCLAAALTPQAHRPLEPDLLGGLGVRVDAERALAARPAAPSRIAGIVAPAMLRQAFEVGAHAPQRAEAAVRELLADLTPGAALLVAGRVLGVEVPAPPRPRRMDARAFEDLLERAHREILGAIGSGRAPELVAPTLHGLLDRIVAEGRPVAGDDIETLRDVGARLAKVDAAALVRQAALILVAVEALLDPAQRAALERLPPSAGSNGVSGSVLLDRATPFGRLVIGGTGRNQYACERVAVIVDLGGDDEYRGPAGGAGENRRLSLVVDVAGDDRYVSGNDGLGSATLGVGLLLDLDGDDAYEGAARCAGFGAGGVGLVLDAAGVDRWTWERDGGGVGCAGIGLHLDLGSGGDTYSTGARSLGVGLPAGVGWHCDAGGNDTREARPGVPAEWRCGIGLGLAPWLPGGVGLCVDAAGDDHLHGSALCAGVGAGGGLGMFVDLAGVDEYGAGAYSLGAGRELGIGVFLEAGGADVYAVVGEPALGVAVDDGLGWAEEREGDDRYVLAGEGLGVALGRGLGVFLDRRGLDRYRAGASRLDPTRELRGPSLALFADEGGGEDEYELAGRAAANGAVERVPRRAPGGEVVRTFSDR